MVFFKNLGFVLSIAALITACGSEKAQAPTTPAVEASTERSLADMPESEAVTVPVVEEQDLAILDTGKLEEEIKPKAIKPVARAKAIAIDKVFDFGFIDEGDKIKHTFTIKNTGNATLRIKDVETACGCTVAKLSAKEVAPGKSMEVNTVFDSLNKFGTQNKEITVVTNGGRITLALKGVVRPKGFKPTSDSSTSS